MCVCTCTCIREAPAAPVGTECRTYRTASADFVLLVKTFKNKGPYQVELYLMQIFDHLKL